MSIIRSNNKMHYNKERLGQTEEFIRVYCKVWVRGCLQHHGCPQSILTNRKPHSSVDDSFHLGAHLPISRLQLTFHSPHILAPQDQTMKQLALGEEIHTNGEEVKEGFAKMSDEDPMTLHSLFL